MLWSGGKGLTIRVFNGDHEVGNVQVNPGVWMDQCKGQVIDLICFQGNTIIGNWDGDGYDGSVVIKGQEFVHLHSSRHVHAGLGTRACNRGQRSHHK